MGGGAIDTAKCLRQHASGIFQFGIAEGLMPSDPAIGIKKALKPIPTGGKQPALKDMAAARQLLVDMEASTSGPLTELASKLLALTAVRPDILRVEPWKEFEGIDRSDPDAPALEALWRVPAERMKLALENKADEVFEHVVPLFRQAVEVLHAALRLTGCFPYLFHSVPSTHQPMSENTLEICTRATATTVGTSLNGWQSTCPPS